MVENAGVAVEISVICHSIPEIQCTSGLQSAILNCASRLTSDNVGSVTIDLGMVENAGVAVGISVICHSIPEIQCTSGLQSAILNCASRLTLGKVGSVTVNSGMVENVG
jgi:hypothetical protein